MFLINSQMFLDKPFARLNVISSCGLHDKVMMHVDAAEVSFMPVGQSTRMPDRLMTMAKKMFTGKIPFSTALPMSSLQTALPFTGHVHDGAHFWVGNPKETLKQGNFLFFHLK